MSSTSTPTKAAEEATPQRPVKKAKAAPTASPDAKAASTSSDDEIRTPPVSPTPKSYAAAVSLAAAE